MPIADTKIADVRMAAACLREHLQPGEPSEAEEFAALLGRLDASAIESWLQHRLPYWPRISQDRAVRLIAGAVSAQRGWLLLSIFDQLDPVLQPLALDEIGMSGESTAAGRLMSLASRVLPNHENFDRGFLRLKAIEAIGRLRIVAAAELLSGIAESKRMWRWTHHHELRLAAFHALSKISPPWAEKFFPRSGFTTEYLELAPINGSHSSKAPNPRRNRQRRYPRVRLRTPLPATATSECETISMEIRGLSLSGGIANGENRLPPGSLVSLRLGAGLRYIRAQAIMRDARPQGLSFEFADMELEERSRLRQLLREIGTTLAPPPDQDDSAVTDSTSNIAANGDS